MRNKTIAKLTTAFVVSAGVSVALLPNQSVEAAEVDNISAQATGNVLVTNTLSVSETKSFAEDLENQQTEAGLSAAIGLIPKVGPFLSAGMTIRNSELMIDEVIEAAENGQRVKISVVEYPPYGDPLGHEVEYSIIN